MLQFIIKGDFEEVPEGFNGKNGHFIADFEALSVEERKELKKNYPQGYFRLGIWERGGSNFDDGQARLVCGLDGERLVPVVVRDRGWRANENHALFIGKELVIVEISRVKRDISINLKKVSIKAKTGNVTETLIWEGTRQDIENLSDELYKFKEVLETAVKKVLEYRCTDAFYYLKN